MTVVVYTTGEYQPEKIMLPGIFISPAQNVMPGIDWRASKKLPMADHGAKEHSYQSPFRSSLQGVRAMQYMRNTSDLKHACPGERVACYLTVRVRFPTGTNVMPNKRAPSLSSPSTVMNVHMFAILPMLTSPPFRAARHLLHVARGLSRQKYDPEAAKARGCVRDLFVARVTMCMFRHLTRRSRRCLCPRYDPSSCVASPSAGPRLSARRWTTPRQTESTRPPIAPDRVNVCLSVVCRRFSHWDANYLESSRGR